MFGELSIVETLVAGGGALGIIFFIWYLTFKYFVKHTEEIQTNHSKQYQHALDQNQSQFASALQQNQIQFGQALKQNQETTDKLFDVMKRDAEYKEILTGILKSLEYDIKIIKKNTGETR